MLVFGVYVVHARDLPELPAMDEWYAGLQAPTTFFAADDLLVGEFFEERRLIVPLERMPVQLIQAFLSAEDERFFQHDGVDPRSVLRALVANITAGKTVQGASTLTQQLAKTLVGREKSYRRKVKEAILARRMEDVYTKGEILTLYLNLIFLGHNSYGVQAAAHSYFRKDVSQLSLGEIAALSVVPPSPSRVNPIRNAKKTVERRAHVLDRMVKNGFVTREEADRAQAEPLEAHPLLDVFSDRLPQAADAGRQALLSRLPTDADEEEWRRGYRVYTTIEPGLQQAAQAALVEELKTLDRKQGYRGPVGIVEPDEVDATLERALDYYTDRGMLSNDGGLVPKSTYLALVASVEKDEVTVRVTPEHGGTLRRRDMKWAGPYKEFPLLKKAIEIPAPTDGDDDGELGDVERVMIVTRRDEDATVSWRPKLKDCNRAFQEGDAVLVTASEDGLKLTQHPKVQGAVISWDPWTGYTRAMVGGTDWDRSEVNRAHALRQTGSTMKPIYYGLAYDQGLRTSSPISDALYVRGGFASTGGADDAGVLLAHTALVKSRNTASLRVSEYVTNHLREGGLDRWRRALGLEHELKGHRAEILGGDQTPWSMSGAFARFLTGGLEPDRVLVKRIVDRNGRVLVDRTHFGDPTADPRITLDALRRDVFRRKPRRLRASTAYLVRHNLRGVVTSGTAAKANRKVGRPAAGKTGSLPFDVWFNGFTQEAVTTVWVGADNRERILGRPKKNARVYGAGVPLSVFVRVTKLAVGDREKVDFLKNVPEAVEFVSVNPKTGNRVGADSGKGSVSLPHRVGFLPMAVEKGEGSTDDIHHSETDF